MLSAKSETVQEIPEKDSVLDIIYADLRRIETLSSQLNRFGSLTSISHKLNAQRGKVDEGRLAGSANALLAKGEGAFSASSSALHGEESEKVYDPKWSNTLAFLDELEGRKLLNRNLEAASLGNFILHSGGLRMRDIRLLKEIWKLPTMRRLIQGGGDGLAAKDSKDRRARPTHASQSRKSGSNELDLIVDLMSVLPHSLQAEIGKEKKVWTVLDEEFLIVSPSTFMLRSC